MCTCSHIYVHTYIHLLLHTHLKTLECSSINIFPCLTGSPLLWVWKVALLRSWATHCRATPPLRNNWGDPARIGPLHYRRSIPSTPWVRTTAKLLLPTARYWRARIAYGIQRHYIRKVCGLWMSRSLEIHSTDSALHCNTRTTLRTVSGRGTDSLIWTVNYLEPHIPWESNLQADIHLSKTRPTCIFDLGLSRTVDKGLIPIKVPLVNFIRPQCSPPPSNLITAIKHHCAKSDATVSSHSDVQFKLRSSKPVNSDRLATLPCTDTMQYISTPQHLLPNKTQRPH